LTIENVLSKFLTNYSSDFAVYHIKSILNYQLFLIEFIDKNF